MVAASSVDVGVRAILTRTSKPGYKDALEASRESFAHSPIAREWHNLADGLLRTDTGAPCESQPAPVPAAPVPAHDEARHGAIGRQQPHRQRRNGALCRGDR